MYKRMSCSVYLAPNMQKLTKGTIRIISIPCEKTSASAEILSYDVKSVHQKGDPCTSDICRPSKNMDSHLLSSSNVPSTDIHSLVVCSLPSNQDLNSATNPEKNVSVLLKNLNF